MIFIIVNTIAMAIRYFNMPDMYSNALEDANIVFAMIFNIECIMKIIGLGKSYFTNNWNLFDFIIVIGTNLALVFKII
jgi:hypothetical protein